jgi:nucleoside-diphosphate-sugar epimerase
MASQSSPLHLVVGAGPIGSAVARRLIAQGSDVRVVTRRGTGPEHPRVERVAADASDGARMRELAEGAVVVYNCVNPPYTDWAKDWPPVADSLLAAAGSCGAVLVTCSNVYGYGPVDGPMTEDLPLAATGVKGRVRAQMWCDALAAHDAGRVRVAEARGSDYVGAGGDSHLGPRSMPKLLAGKRISVLGDPDVPHTFTYTEDMAMTLVALGADPRAWGRAWHVPSALTCTQREAFTRLAELTGSPAPRLSPVSPLTVRALGLVVPVMRELPEVAYQVERPFVLDSSAAQRELGLVPTPADDVLRAHAAAFVASGAAGAAGRHLAA